MHPAMRGAVFVFGGGTDISAFQAEYENNQAELKKATKRRNALLNAHVSAQARFEQNPADVFAVDELMAAIDQVQASAEGRSKAEAAAKASGQAFAKAQEKLDGARQQAMAKARDQVKREITELREKQEGAGPNRQTVLDKLLSGFAATARAEGKAEPLTKATMRIDEASSEYVSNESNPLEQMGGSSIIKEDIQGDAEAGADREESSSISKAKADEIIGTPKYSRPDPSIYLDERYIASHKMRFANGVTKISYQAPSGFAGPPGGTFVMPSNVADKLIAQADGDISILEYLLGLEPGSLGMNPVRIDITNPAGLRMPSGNEKGANDKWIPGGYTSGGIPEMVIDSPGPEQYAVTPIK